MQGENSVRTKRSTAWRGAIAAAVTVGLITSSASAATKKTTKTTKKAAATTSAPASTVAVNPADAGLDLNATLRVTIDGSPEKLDPHAEPTQGSTPYWTPIYDTLTDVTVIGQLKPRIATKWAFSADGLSLVLDIRSGVKFHDGTAVDAAVVAANLNRARTGSTSSAGVKGTLAAVTGASATGPMQVTLALSRYDASLPSVLGTAAGAIINLKQVDAGFNFTTGSAGTGAYVVEQFVPLVSVSYKRATDANWDPAAGKLAGMKIDYLTDFKVALNGLQSGQYDMVRVNGLGAQVDSVVKSGGFQAVDVNPNQTLSLWLNNQDPVFKDVRVRQAFAYAIDRDAIAKAVFDNGTECKAASQMYPFPGDALYVEGYDPYHYDPAKARLLLAQAKAEFSKITIIDIGSTSSINLAQAVQPMLQSAGFDVTLQRGTGAVVAVAFQRGEVQVAVIPNAQQAHGTITLSRYWLTAGPYHLAKGEDGSILSSLATLSNPTLSDDKVAQTYQDIAKQLAGFSTLVPACAIRWTFVAKKNIINVDPRTVLTNMRVVAVKKS